MLLRNSKAASGRGSAFVTVEVEAVVGPGLKRGLALRTALPPPWVLDRCCGACGRCCGRAGPEVGNCCVHGCETSLELRHKSADLRLEGFCLLEAVLLLHRFDLQELSFGVAREETELLLKRVASCGLLGFAQH